MKNKLKSTLRLITLAVGLATVRHAQAQGTAFTYQGRLTDGATPANGSYDLRVILFDNSVGGSQQGPVLTNSATPVVNGVFSITLDFGAVFPGAGRWLEIAVRTNGNGGFSTLSPRQPLTPSPYAITAGNVAPGAGLSGTYGSAVTFSNAGNSFAGSFTGTVSGTVSGDGSGLSNVNAATVGGLSPANFWNTSGNAGANPTNGAFIGTTDNQPLEFRVNGTRVLRLEPTGAGEPPNLIGGIAGNVVDSGVVGSTISGGGTVTSPGLGPNHISASMATIGGGSQNTNGGGSATIGGGQNNNINPDLFSFATIAGGSANKIQGGADESTIGGGAGNNIGLKSANSTISGGSDNTIGSNSTSVVISGGEENSVADGNFAATINGGANNAIFADGGFSIIGGGSQNLIGATGSGGATSGGCNIIGGGYNNNIRTNADFGTISGGEDNLIAVNSDFVTIAGGEFNSVSDSSSECVISGGDNNSIGSNTLAGVISGGISNVITPNGSFAVIPGGDVNTATSHAFAAGHRAKAIHDGAFVWADDEAADFASTAANQFLIRAAGGVGIGTPSPATALHVADNGDTEISIQNTNTGGHRYTLQSSSTNASATVSASFQIIDRTTGNLRLIITTNGLVGIAKNNPATALDVNGTVTATAFNPPSDRNLKENFTPVSPRDVLSKVVAIPITRWNFISDPATLHVGPMAQDFRAAFGLGTDERHIATVDADGVALAAIQGLNQKLEEKDARITAMEKELSKIKATLAKLTNPRNEP